MDRHAAPAPHDPRPRTGPVIATGVMLGLGMGGFIDGIVLHQILQWHQMISAVRPPDTLLNKEINMVWDGAFHAVTWSFTAVGIAMLWRLPRRPGSFHRSTPMFLGALLLGWGLFNLLDSVFNHYLFNLHNVNENVPNPGAWNLGFLALSLAQTALGGWIVQRHRRAASV